MKMKHLFVSDATKKLYIFLFGLAIPLMIVVNKLTNQRNENGYHFILFFISILPTIILFDIIMLKTIKEDEKIPKNPFYLMKYVIYVFLLFFSFSPILYLWGMRDVIAHLKW
jgi:hypothetical protein